MRNEPRAIRNNREHLHANTACMLLFVGHTGVVLANTACMLLFVWAISNNREHWLIQPVCYYSFGQLAITGSTG